MINQRKLIRITEITLIAFVWLALLITPILFAEDNNKPIMESVLNQFKTLIPLSALLIINRFYLVPRMLFKGRSTQYITAIIGLICLLTLGIYFMDANKLTKPPLPPGLGQDRQENRNPPRPGSPENFDAPPQGKSEPMPAFANFFILSILIIGFDTGLKATLRWSEAEQEKAILEKENMANQLVLLKNQIGPHFFMNTLNNIHSLMDINAEEAKSAIIKLSKMMRYLLPETNSKESTLAREVEFIENDVRLMKLRLSERVKITLDLPENLPDKTIPPFLFIPLIENAFKHGVSYKDESFISIGMVTGNDKLLFSVKNSKTSDSKSGALNGSGIDIYKKRLGILYGKEHHLDIIENKEIFTVNLSIPL